MIVGSILYVADNAQMIHYAFKQLTKKNNTDILYHINFLNGDKYVHKFRYTSLFFRCISVPSVHCQIHINYVGENGRIINTVC